LSYGILRPKYLAGQITVEEMKRWKLVVIQGEWLAKARVLLEEQ